MALSRLARRDEGGLALIKAVLRRVSDVLTPFSSKAAQDVSELRRALVVLRQLAEATRFSVKTEGRDLQLPL